jgi:PAS domain S-box-containing protein
MSAIVLSEGTGQDMGTPGKENILVVDDNNEGRSITKLILQRAGFAVTEARSFGEAEQSMFETIDLIVLDVNLPDGSGLDFARAIRSKPDTASIPIVHTSAVHTAVRDRVAGLNSGADAYLVDPFDPSILVATVQALLRIRSAEKAEKQSAQRITVLQKVTAAFNRAATELQVSEAVSVAAKDLVSVQQAIVYLFGSRNSAGDQAGSHANTVFSVEPDSSLMAASQTGLRVVGVANPSGKISQNTTETVAIRTDTVGQRTELALPLLADDAILGAVRFEFDCHPTEDEIDYLEVVAAQASQAFQRAQLYEFSLSDLRHSERRLQLLIEHAPEAIVIIDASAGQLVEANPAAERMFGVERKDLITKDLPMISPENQPDGRKSISTLVELLQGAAVREIPEFEWTFIRSGTTAEEVTCEVRLLRLPNPRDDRVLVRGSILDIGQRKRAETAERAAAQSAVIAAREREIALELQLSMVPARLEEISRVSLCARYAGASDELAVGGDWFDSVVIDEQRIAICVGDVVGHGVLAVTAMGQLRSAVAAQVSDCSGPVDLLVKLERFSKRVSGAMFATVCYGEFDAKTGTLSYACAGHPPALLLAADGKPRSFLMADRHPLRHSRNTHLEHRERYESRPALPSLCIPMGWWNGVGIRLTRGWLASLKSQPNFMIAPFPNFATQS